MDEDERGKAWLLAEKYGGVETPEFFADCERLESGEPLAYVIGWQPFLDLKIGLGSKPLIPRPETEYWAGKAIEKVHAQAEDLCRNVVAVQGVKTQILGDVHILDLCAGSGAIGVAVAKAVPTARVDFAEIDATHHATITDNICNNGIDYTQTRIFGGDLFAEIPHGTTYDFILTNPPYIDPAVDRAEASVKDHEPHLALYGGAAGMELIARIIETAPLYLTPSRQLWIEHEPEQAEEIARLAAGRFATVIAQEDQYGVVRYSILCL